jgi:hypothetical protein
MFANRTTVAVVVGALLLAGSSMGVATTVLAANIVWST